MATFDYYLPIQTTLKRVFLSSSNSSHRRRRFGSQKLETEISYRLQHRRAVVTSDVNQVVARHFNDGGRKTSLTLKQVYVDKNTFNVMLKPLVGCVLSHRKHDASSDWLIL